MSTPTTITPSAPAVDPDFLDTVGFITAAEEGSLTQEQFDASAQAFVDSGTWRHLQGSWQRNVRDWADQGLVSL